MNPNNSSSPDPTTASATPPTIAALPAPERDLLAELNVALASNAQLYEEVKRLREEREAFDGNSFISVLNHMEAGTVLIEAGAQIEELNTMVLDRQEKGVFSLKITMKPLGNKLCYTPVVTISEPKIEPRQCVFFVGDGGKPLRNDPRQRELPLR